MSSSLAFAKFARFFAQNFLVRSWLPSLPADRKNVLLAKQCPRYALKTAGSRLCWKWVGGYFLFFFFLAIRHWKRMSRWLYEREDSNSNSYQREETRAVSHHAVETFDVIIQPHHYHPGTEVVICLSDRYTMMEGAVPRNCWTQLFQSVDSYLGYFMEFATKWPKSYTYHPGCCTVHDYIL